jgi:hypothetical protein
MPKNMPLHAYIGDPVCLFAPAAISSNGQTASDAPNSIPLAGWDGVLFMEITGATDALDVHQFSLIYSTTAYASDGATSDAAWTTSDAVFVVGPHAAVGDIHMLDFHIGAKELSGGSLHLHLAAADETGVAAGAVIAIPYGGTRRFPSTNAFTVVVADDPKA